MQLIQEENNAEYLNQQPRKFYLDCSGSDTDILKVCPTFEINRHSFTGQLLLFTSFFACIGGAYLFYLIFENIPIGIFFGLLYGGFIFTLDRAIISDTKNLFGKKKIEDNFSTISKTKPSNNIFKTLLVIFLRMGLAIMSSFIVAKSIELYVFSPTIEKGLAERNFGIIDRADKEAEKTINEQSNKILSLNANVRKIEQDSINLATNFDNQISTCKTEAKDLYTTCNNNSINLLAEKEQKQLNGESTTILDKRIIAVFEPWNKKKNECADLQTKRSNALNNIGQNLKKIRQGNNTLIVNSTKLSNDAIARSEEFKNKVLPTFEKDKLLPARFAALSEALEKDKSLGVLGLWLSLFLLGIELTPLFRKLVMPRGKYEAKLEQVEEITTMQYDVEIQAFEEIGASSYKEIEKIKAKYEGEFKQKIETIHNLGTNMGDEISDMENEISEYFIKKLTEIELEPNEAIKNFKMQNLTTLLNLNIQTINKMAENYTEILQKKA